MADNKISGDFIEMEHKVIDFWDKNECFKKRQEQNKGHERFKFIDGPITANNPMGIHHAWGRSLKDAFIRYKSMQGFDCRCQNGFDSQGLWVEVEVEKELGFETKKDIENYGMDKFTEKCKDRVKHFSGIIADQSKRLGQWMDWDNSYFTNTDQNIEGIWHFLKKCDENGWIEREYKPMPWCPRCGTSLSEHEMTGSYKTVTHDSVFFKLPLKEMDAKMLVWTTTPWTLSSNVALAVNPDMDYVLVSVKSDPLPLILSKTAIKHLGDDKLEVKKAFKGSELVGMHFETCFPEFEKQQEIDHKVVAWEDVDDVEGSGIVHIAPGCGAEDFELGRRIGLSEVMPVDDSGIFLDGFGFMSGKDSAKIKQEVFDELEKRNKLYKVVPIEHSYPHCWRCKHEVIFRLVPAWYIRTDELKPRLIKNAQSVLWEPESNGKRMVDWLTNMGDWNISRKRYYGMPLPFYVCEKCGHVHVVGSKKELRELAVDKEKVDNLKELHRPWIDEIKIRCPECGEEVSRISEIGDVWLDAGIVPFSTTGYFTDKEEWEKNYPADWVVEMREQVRLWFYSMLFMSTVLEDKAPYKRVLCHSSVVQENGNKFSKTGFMIRFEEAAEKIGADTVRYMYLGAPVTNDVRFGYNLGDEARRKLLGFFNTYTFFDTYASLDNPDFSNYTPDKSKMTVMDKWLILRTNTFIKKATEFMDDFKAYNLIKEFELFVDDISNWYIRANRRRFWKTDDNDDKMIAYWTLFNAINACTLCMAPIIPFMTEEIWQNMTRRVLPESPISVHLASWPKPIEGFCDEKLERETKAVREIIAVSMRLRNEASIKVRQPLKKLFVTADGEKREAVKIFEKNIKDELNVKEIVILDDKSEIETEFLSLNFRKAGAALKQNVNKMKQALLDTDDEKMSEYVKMFKAGTVCVDGFDAMPAEIFTLETKTKASIVSGLLEDKSAVAFDITLTPDLIKEGNIRDVIRQCQIIRKEAGYTVEQRVILAVNANGSVLNVLRSDLDHMKAELLADDILLGESLDADLTKEFDLGDEKVTISVKKA